MMGRAGRFAALRFVAATAIWLALAAPTVAGEVAAPERNPLLVPPGSDSNPLDVAVGLHIINIAAIDEVSENFTIDAYLLARWKDARLAYTPREPGDDRRQFIAGQIWLPKIEMVNAATPRDKYDTAIIVSPDGTVNYAERCKATLSSKFLLRRFPFDTQLLSIIVHPFVSNAHNMTFSLNDHKTWVSSELNSYSSLAQWELLQISPALGSAQIYDGSQIAELRFEILVRRHSAFYMWKVFLPLTLMVVLSWAAFFVEEKDLTNQVTIAVTTLLTVIAFAFAISSTMPRVPYLTYIDAFFLQCYVFVFLAMAELMTVHVTHRSDRRRDLGVRIRHVSRWVVPTAFALCNLTIAVHFLGR
jgi:hypothetical protein